MKKSYRLGRRIGCFVFILIALGLWYFYVAFNETHTINEIDQEKASLIMNDNLPKNTIPYHAQIYKIKSWFSWPDAVDYTIYAKIPIYSFEKSNSTHTKITKKDSTFVYVEYSSGSEDEDVMVWLLNAGVSSVDVA